jgi:hypothetical protein
MAIDPADLKIIEEYLKSLKGEGPGELEMLANQPAELRKGLSQQSTFGDSQKLLQQQLKRAQEKSDSPMATGRTVRDGIYVRPAFSEMLSGAMKQVEGGLQENTLNSQLSEALRGHGKTTDAYNEWKQKQAGDFVANRKAQAAGQPSAPERVSPPVLQPPDTTGVDLGHDLGPRIPPRRKLATSQAAPAPGQEVPALPAGNLVQDEVLRRLMGGQ